MWRDLAQPSHLLILAIIVLVLFGWKKLPDAARSVGRSMRIFKSEISEMKNDGREGRPSPAASDTVDGGVVPPASPPQGWQQPAPQAQSQPQGPPQQQQPPQQQAPQQQAPQPGAQQPGAQQPAAQPVPHAGSASEPARHDYPAL